MKINARYLGISAAVALCFVYTILCIVLKSFPTQTLKFIGMIHMMPKLEYIKPFITVTPQAIIIGAITHIIFIFILFWLIASIYNLLQRFQR